MLLFMKLIIYVSIYLYIILAVIIYYRIQFVYTFIADKSAIFCSLYSLTYRNTELCSFFSGYYISNCTMQVLKATFY